MEIKAIVFGKKGCSLCENRKQVLTKFPQIFTKKTGKPITLNMVYHDISTVDGLVSFCREDRTVADIPVVLLEDPSGRIVGKWEGPRAVMRTNDLIDLLAGE